jgi:type II secretory pathway component PulF
LQFQYQVADSKGAIERGSAEADSKEQLIAKLKSQGKYPLEIKESASLATISLKIKFSRKDKLSDKERLSFTQQMAGLLSAKIPLERALNTLTRLKFGSKMDEIIVQLRRLLQEGHSFSSALEKYPNYFPPMYISMVKIGEAGGILPQVMSRLAQNQEEEMNFRRYLVSSLFYPVIVMGLSLCSIGFFVMVVIPQFQSVFQDMGMQLPLVTRLVMFFGQMMVNFWFVPVIAIGGFAFWWIRQSATPQGKLRVDQLKLKIPVLGKVFEKIATQKMAQSLSLLIGSGVSLLESLVITGDIIGNEVFGTAMRETERRVRQGNTLANSLASFSVFPLMAVEMIAVGEEGGNLEYMLEQVNRIYNNEVKHDLGMFLAVIEPLITVLLVAVIAILAVAILLPVLGMNSQINPTG